MAFATKTDYCGLVTATTPSGEGATSPLVVKDSTLNGSEQKYQPQGQDGSFISTEIFGQDSAPKNSYGLKSTLTTAAGDIELNSITTVLTKKYALESIEIGTGSAQAPTISATCQEIESTATDANQCKYEVPALTLTTKQHAQILFGAFSFSGTGANLIACSASVSCTIGKEKVAGTKIASDCNSGIITVSGTILVTGENATAPTVTATTADGWIVTKAPADNETNPETAYKSYTFEVQKTLAKAS